MVKKSKAAAGHIAGGLFKGLFGSICRFLATIMMVGIITGCIVASVLTVYILGYVGSDDEIKLEDVELGYSSTMVAYDKEGNEIELQKLYLPDNNRIWVDYNNISENVKAAVIAIEDKRFWEHQGVDWRRTFGAFADMFMPGASKGGGSTITQQLIKNITDDDAVRVDRKVREIFRAINLDKNYSKERILEAYLNVVPFGAGTNGIESAALTYFNKHASELDLAEAAAVVGITKYPTYYNPRINPEANKERQEWVLWEMLQQGKITQKEFDDACDQVLDFRKDDALQADQAVNTYFEDLVINQVLKDLQERKGWTASHAFEQLYKGGYKIYTTVDTDMQKYLEEFYKTSELFPKVHNAEYPQSCATIIDPNGKIVAVVGGVGEKTKNRILNRATMSTRQPGSSIKPIGPYAVAFEYNQVTWSTIIVDSQINLSEPGKPDRLWPVNYYTGFRGPMTVAYAIQQSVNTVSAKLVRTMGPETVFDFLRNRLNMHSLIDSAVIDGAEHSDIGLAPMALGALTKGVTPLEMAGAYQIFVNGGNFTTPYCYTKVEDANGRVILQTDTAPVRVISEDTAVILNKALQTVTTMGTGTDARLGEVMPTGGKTGTSEHDVNQWFVGFTPYYVCQVWLGYDEEVYRDEYGNVVPNTIKYAGLGYPPPKLWKSIMLPIHQGLEYKQFLESDNVVSRQYCTISGDLAGANCPTASGWYKLSRLPATCQGHVEEEDTKDKAGDKKDDDDTGNKKVTVKRPKSAVTDEGSVHVPFSSN